MSNVIKRTHTSNNACQCLICIELSIKPDKELMTWELARVFVLDAHRKVCHMVTGRWNAL